MSVRCGYKEPWGRVCRLDRPCPVHEGVVCWCGDRASLGCTIAVSLVCGAPLCPSHECKIPGHWAAKVNDGEKP